jgi:septum formation protein
MSPTTLSSARPLLLASGSPRRREILGNLGVPLVVRATAADESTRATESANDYLVRVVAAKLDAAEAVLGGAGAEADSALAAVIAVLVADTSVIVDGEVLGKPDDDDHAHAMISRLAGRTHEVWTRFALRRVGIGGAGAERAETVRTRVTFRALPAARVSAYVATAEGRDKAGAYAVQGRGAALVARIEGSYTNVVGLPACEVAVALEEMGLLP